MDQRIRRPDWKRTFSSVQTALAKFKIPLLVLALGALLLVWTPGTQRTEVTQSAEVSTEEAPSGTRQEMERLLSQVEGVGRVELMLTTTGSQRSIYQTDLRVSGDTREETTVFSSQQGSQKTPVVARTEMAEYLGAVIVCDGADSAAVRLRVVQAVSALTGLGSDKISVIKMKRQ